MWVLLPLKHLSAAKHRLGRVLSAAERGALVHAMASDLLEMLARHPGVSRVVVCSNDAQTARLAARWDAEFLAESGLGGVRGMNQVVNAAAGTLAARGAEDLACIAGDVPLLTGSELQRFLDTHAGARRPCVTLAPDRWRQGTNLIAWQPASGFSVAFGPGSLERHRARAAQLGAGFSLCEAAGSGLDIDEPGDLQTLAFDTPPALAPHTRRYLNESGLAARLARMEPSMEAVREASG